ncbi:MAG TPA: phosphotransferase [Phycisphaerae bacterium]|nr:phosphotransferase [Phycisphaerae bacterium]HUU22686.1 phosphotransferase [Phycisphaerae bacterium]
MALERDTFGPSELAVALSHYDTGIITAIRDFPRGSRRSPKAIIDCQRGRLLFKRRGHGAGELGKVAFAHQVQLHLAAEGFPLPHLIGTRPDNNSMLVLGDRIYELFEYIEGGSYDGSLEATFHAGKILGLYHKLLVDFRSDYTPPTAGYHGHQAISQAISRTIEALPDTGRPDPGALSETVGFLKDAYQTCGARADEAGVKDWPAQIVHGDWHPGNMLFRDNVVVAVIDYDSSRLQQRVMDLANGALQFSILGGSADPSEWPDHLDQTRLRRFLTGYDSANVISRGELGVIGYLMCEALIAEAVLPIAATGRFGRMDGFPFLQTIRRKVAWIIQHMKEVNSALKD